MAKNVFNKAGEVIAWYDRSREHDHAAVKRYVDERWPLLDADLRDQIVATAWDGIVDRVVRQSQDALQ